MLGALDVAKGQYQNPTYSQNQVRTYSRTDVERLMRDVEQSSQDFDRDFDSWLGRSSSDPGHEDVYNRDVHDLIDALTTLRSNFNSRNDWWLARSDMLRALSAATNVNSIMSSREIRGSGLNRQWARLRTNLNTLANAFNLPQVGTTFAGIQTYPDYGGNARNCTTTGIFRGYTNTGETELTISANGQATARSLAYNALYSGRCANDVLYFDWGSFKVVREGRNNIATVEIGNERNRTSYRRVSGSQVDIGSNYPTYPTYPTDQYGNVPSWAIGVFRGVTNNGEAELTIAPNGIATMRSLNSNELFNGRYANSVLTFDWGSFNLVSEGNGISTVDVRNRRNRTSYRRISGYQGNNDSGYSGYPTQGSNVPSWAVGTFRGMTNTGESEMRIDATGAVTMRSLNSNELFNGRYENDVLTFDWGSFRLFQENGGIRTEEVGNRGNRTSYRRIN